MASRCFILTWETYQSTVSALSWFKGQFVKCNDHAALVKTWLLAQYDGLKIYLE